MPITDDSGDVRTEARQSAEHALDRVKAEGQRLSGELRDEARGAVDRSQQSAAGYLHDVSEAIGSAKQTLDDQGHRHTAGVFQAAADELNQLGDNVSRQDAGSLLREIEDFAQRQPALFFAGALIAGFGAVRFLRSTREGQPPVASTTRTTPAAPVTPAAAAPTPHRPSN